eukprot:1161959-Pelagomonas_calceolata.AAC.1
MSCVGRIRRNQRTKGPVWDASGTTSAERCSWGCGQGAAAHKGSGVGMVVDGDGRTVMVDGVMPMTYHGWRSLVDGG